MLGDDEDVFDSVTWESPSAPSLDVDNYRSPGFKQSTADSDEGRGPNDPRWEWYLITSVKDPVKELAETKDAYVSYLVSAKVRAYESNCWRTPLTPYRPIYQYFPLPTPLLAGASRTLFS